MKCQQHEMYEPTCPQCQWGTKSLTARCVEGHREVLSQKQLDEAQQFGCAICSQCGSAMVVERAAAVDE